MATRVPNPEYRSDWEALHDAAAERRASAWAACQAIETRDRISSRAIEYEALRQEHNDANRLCCKCLDNFQHETLNNCLEWLKRNTVTKYAFDLSPQDYTTAPQLISAFCRLSNLEDDVRCSAKFCLPLAAPRPFTPFSDPTKVRSVATIMPPSGEPMMFDGFLMYSRRNRIDVLFTFYKTLTWLHVVVRNIEPHQGNVINFAEHCIEYFDTNAEVLLKRAYGDKAPRFAPAKVKFYVYMPPVPHCREIFNWLEFESNGNVRFRSMGSMPACLRADCWPGGTLKVAAELAMDETAFGG
ncbi:MAG: hypothetical protein ACYDD1_15900 [Caulobacteraceae bacterium]